MNYLFIPLICLTSRSAVISLISCLLFLLLFWNRFLRCACRGDKNFVRAFVELRGACIVDHEVRCVAARWARSGAHRSTSIHDRLGSSIVHVVSLLSLHVRIFASAERVRALRLHVEQIAWTLLPWRVLVGHSWLHHFLQTLTLLCKLIHCLVLHLKSVLKIHDHALFNLL